MSRFDLGLRATECVADAERILGLGLRGSGKEARVFAAMQVPIRSVRRPPRGFNLVSKLVSIGIGLILVVPSRSTCAITVRSEEMREAHSWFITAFGGEGPELPFSFVYGGRPSSEMLRTCRVERGEKRMDRARVQRTLSYTDTNTALNLRCDSVAYTDYPAVEWVLYFENRGNRDTPILSDVWSADFTLTLTGTATDEYVLHHADGSQGVISDFRPHQTPLARDTRLTFAPEGGRSSDGVMPYFNLSRTEGGGVMIAVGWTGQWTASFTRDAGPNLTVHAGMASTHLRLQPGERIRTPAMLLLFYSGDRMRGHNLWRQLMLRHYTPSPGGHTVDPPVAASAGAIAFNSVTETNQRDAIANVAKKGLPVDTWWLDAGWSTGGFPGGMGTWDADRARFPNGLRPVADAAHKAGLKFLLWFEPERVMPGTWLRLNHPEWLLTPSNLPAPLAYQKDWRLLNLGNPEALAWAKSTFSRRINNVGIDVYRHDCNIHPLYYWRNGEPSDRQGVHEIRYVEGLYDFFDTLARENPGLLLDNCASGGRRLDFEMMKRSIPLWRSDYCWDPVGAQSIACGLSYWLPLHGLGAVATDPYHFRSGMGTNAAFALNFYSEQEHFWPSLTERIREYHRLRKYFFGDYYPLTPYATGKDAWIAWQYDRPDLGEGLVQAFRRAESPAESIRVILRGLESDADYEVTDLDAAEPIILKGSDLMAHGLVVTRTQRPSAAVLTYKRIAE